MDHVFVLYDRMTNSVWYPENDSSLQAVGGAQKGASLPFLDEPAPVSLVLLPAEVVGKTSEALV